MLTVKNITKRDFLKISLLENVKNASLKIKKYSDGCLFVFDKDKFCGIVTSNELSGQDPNRLIADISINKIQPLGINSSVEDAYNYFKTTEIVHLAVADNKGRVIGILSRDDLWSGIVKELKISYKSLEKRYSDLDTLKELVQELGASLKITGIFERLIRAFKKTLHPSSNFAYVLAPVESGQSTNTIYVYATGTIGNTYLKSIEEDIVGKIHNLTASVLNKPADWTKNDFIFEVLGGMKDDKNTKLPLSRFSVPISVGNELLGAISISSLESDVFSEKDFVLADTMIRTTASTVSRLRQLLESEQSRIQSLVESMSNGVILFDIDQRVTMSNPAAQKMSGLPARGFDLSEFTKIFKNGLDKKVNQVLERGNSVHVEEILLSRFVYEIFITSIYDYEKKIIGGAIILHDITHIKEIDRMKTEFVSVASHQLRTPLTAIKLFIEMLANEEAGKLNIKQKEYMVDVQQSTERMIKLVGDLLNVSRLETGRLKIEPKPIQIEDFIQSIIDEAEPVANEHKCRIVFKYSKEKLFKISIDPSLMRQVIYNLIINAIRYSSTKESSIFVKLERRKNDYLVSVKDTGIGIPGDVKLRIFEKFFRADNAQKAEAEGSGLGLYVCKMIMEASGGKIWFESPPKGKESGTTFYISIPAKGMVEKKGEKMLVGSE